MAEEHPPLNKPYVQSYDQGHFDYPIVAVSKDPTAPGYKLPEEFSWCPWPKWAKTHRFIDSIPTPGTGDLRVQWIYRRLPGPIITGQQPDPQTGILQVFSEQDVQADTADGTPLTTITPTDSTVDRIVTQPVPSAALRAFSLGFPDYQDIDLPEVLTAVAVSWQLGGGDGSYEENASTNAVGTDSINLSLGIGGSGQGSANVVPEIIPTYAPKKGKNVPVMQYFFYLEQPNTHASLFEKLLTLDAATFAVESVVAGVVSATNHDLSVGEQFQFRTLVDRSGANFAVDTTYFVKTAPDADTFTYALTLGGAAVTTGGAASGTAIPVILPWPNFQEVSDTLILKGQKVSGRITIKAHSAMSANSAGDQSVAESTGVGTDGDVSVSNNAVVLKPSIHAAITLSGGATNSLTKDIDATAEITGTGSSPLPNSGTTLSGTVFAEGEVTPAIIAATPVTAIPTLGRYMFKLNLDMSRYTGFSVARAIVVDFAEV